LIYKHESQVPTQLQRKLNSLAGLFETVDDEFERIRAEREAYLAEVRDSTSTPGAFLENELNLDSFKEYLNWAFPSRPLEAFPDQTRLVLDLLLGAGCKTLLDIDRVVQEAAGVREVIIGDLALDAGTRKAKDGAVPSALEPLVALSVSRPELVATFGWSPSARHIIAERLTKRNPEG
jgi:hypothetical protein